MRGSFAACFSKSGKYLAVATQYGLISVFDVESLPEPISPLVVFTSSRPGVESGAIRAMEFSPGPFDLLAWTEASGRVGVADVRTLFLSRQRLDIDSHANGVERVIVSDRAGEPMIDPRLRTFRTDSPSTPDYLGLDLERRQLRHLTQEMLDRHQAPLTAEE
jgi:WD40 repeat protein